MASEGLWALAGGIVTLLVSGIPVELFKRHIEVRCVAAIFVADMVNVVNGLAGRAFDTFAEQIMAGQFVPYKYPGSYDAEYAKVYDTFVSKLAFLPADVSFAIVKFYKLDRGMRGAMGALFDHKNYEHSDDLEDLMLRRKSLAANARFCAHHSRTMQGIFEAAQPRLSAIADGWGVWWFGRGF